MMNTQSPTRPNRTLAVLDGRGVMPDLQEWLADDGFEIKTFPSPEPILEALEGGQSFAAVLIDNATSPGVEVIRRMKSLLQSNGSVLFAASEELSAPQLTPVEQLVDGCLPTPLTRGTLREALNAMPAPESARSEEPVTPKDEGSESEMLAGMMLHDIRNAVMAVRRIGEHLGQVELLSPGGRRDLECLIEAGRGAMKSIEQVRRSHAALAYAPVKAMKMPVKVREVVREAAHTVGFAPGMVSWSPAMADPEAWLDGVLFRRVLEHLLSNAQLHGDDTAELRVRVDDSRMLVEVGDRGPGLPDGFEGEGGALNLGQDQYGLTYARSAVEAHGGQMEFCPREGGGLMVRTIWPDVIRTGRLADGDATPRTDPACLNIWLVDDEPYVLSATSRLLRLWKHKVTTFLTGESMLQQLNLVDPPPDLILCDSQLGPCMRGLEVLRKVRTLSPRTFRMLYTAYSADAEVVDAFNEGVVQRYTQKGAESAELKRCIDVVVQINSHPPRNSFTPEDEILRARFETMLSEELITLHLQPILDSQTRQPVACEALMRSKHPDFRGPLDILDAARTFDRDMALQKVLTRVARRIRSQLPEHMLLFVNVDPSLVTSVDHVDAVLGDLYPMAGNVILELTERARLGADASQAVKRLRELGFRIALDDVGAGYNSLAAVVAVDPEVLKLDISLVSGLDQDSRKAEMVRLLVGYANSHGIDTVAEGIERPEEAVMCSQLGVRWLQGYHFCRPMPIEQVAEKYGFKLRDS